MSAHVQVPVSYDEASESRQVLLRTQVQAAVNRSVHWNTSSEDDMFEDMASASVILLHQFNFDHQELWRVDPRHVSALDAVSSRIVTLTLRLNDDAYVLRIAAPPQPSTDIELNDVEQYVIKNDIWHELTMNDGRRMALYLSGNDLTRFCNILASKLRQLNKYDRPRASRDFFDADGLIAQKRVIVMRSLSAREMNQQPQQQQPQQESRAHLEQKTDDDKYERLHHIERLPSTTSYWDITSPRDSEISTDSYDSVKSTDVGYPPETSRAVHDAVGRWSPPPPTPPRPAWGSNTMPPHRQPEADQTGGLHRAVSQPIPPPTLPRPQTTLRPSCMSRPQPEDDRVATIRTVSPHHSDRLSANYLELVSSGSSDISSYSYATATLPVPSAVRRQLDQICPATRLMVSHSLPPSSFPPMSPRAEWTSERGRSERLVRQAASERVRSPVEPVPWSCSRCTFDNHPDCIVCEMCELHRQDATWQCPTKNRCPRGRNPVDHPHCYACGAWKCRNCRTVNFRSSSTCVTCSIGA